jgi:hypothetical protein
MVSVMVVNILGKAMTKNKIHTSLKCYYICVSLKRYKIFIF